MPRFFITEAERKEDKIVVSGEDFHHIINVLRYKPNDSICFSDGKKVYDARISDIQKGCFLAEILEIKEETSGNSQPFIHLYQAIIKGDKMDLVIQKATELGVSKITPIVTKNTVVKMDEKEESKLLRWQKIANEASTQSERLTRPTIGNVKHFNDAIPESTQNGFSLFCYEREEECSIKEVLKSLNQKEISIFIGPEGGFSKEEIQLAKDKNIQFVSLGKTILRAETASILAIGLISYEIS